VQINSSIGVIAVNKLSLRFPIPQFTSRVLHHQIISTTVLLLYLVALASCVVYARAFIEYVCGCVLFQYVTVREIRVR